MPIAPGARFGSYQVVEPIGSGGMGEVYRARDTHLKRDVALKTLPPAVANDADRLARFQREAEVLASLNHPNIAQIYGLERSEGTTALAMELIEGPTLEDRISQGRIPVDEALRIATQIAEALEAAHRRGIVHRDLKPANIKLRSDGIAKVLDFGIAKIVAGDTSPPGPAATTEVGATRTGFVVGTTAYMSPEQAQGLAVDQRADIWSFGCVLYEMLAGRPAFVAGEAAISNDVVDTLPASVSPNVRRTLRLCLQRSSSRRLADIRDVRLGLEGAFDSDIADGARNARAARAALPWAAALVATVIAVALSWAWRGADTRAAPAPRPPVRLALDLGALSFATDFPVATLSPDGTLVVFVAAGRDGVAHLATRRLDQFAATSLPGTERAYAPFFSPDGEWVGFFADGKLKKIRLDGGAAIVLCNAAAGRGASWGDDGWIVAALDNRSGLVRISASDGTVARLTELGPGEVTHRWPQVLPGAKAVLFTVGHVSGNYGAADIAVASLDGGRATIKIVRAAAGMAPHYLETGHVVYVANGVLYALPFDAATLEVRGAAFVVIDEVSAAIGFGAAQMAFSRTGAALYRSGKTPGRTVLRWLAADGRTDVLWNEAGLYQYPRVSPDGRRLAAAVADGPSSDVWIYDLERGSKTRLTSEGVNTSPIWMPDGKYVVFRSQAQLYAARADGAEHPVLLMRAENPLNPMAFTPDGRRLLFFEQLPSGGAAMSTVAVEEDSGRLHAGGVEQVHETPSGFPMPALSPDGRWIAYASAESGIYEVYVRAFPDDGRQWTISTGGANFPLWSRTANELFYRTEDQLLMATSYAVVDGEFRPGRPRVWSDQRIFNTGLVANFDVAPDGAHFAVLWPADDPTALESHPLMLHVNFFDEVRRRAASGR